MILDHGSDAVTACVIAMSVSKIVGFNKLLQSLVLGITAFLFFLALLEQ